MKAGMSAKTIVIFVGVLLAATAGLIAIYAFSGKGDGSQAAKDGQTSPSGQASPPGGTGSGETWSSNRLTPPQQYQQTKTTAEQKLNSAKSRVKKLLASAAEASLDLNERVKCIDSAWTTIFKAMESALGTGEMIAETMKFAEDQLKSADGQTEEIIAKGVEEAKKAFDDAKSRPNPNERLEYAIRAIETVYTVEYAGRYRIMHSYPLSFFDIKSQFIDMAAELITKNNPVQNDDNEMMKNFNDAVNEFYKIAYALKIPDHIIMAKKIAKLLECAGKMKYGTLIMGVSVSRIVDAIQKCAYDLPYFNTDIIKVPIYKAKEIDIGSFSMLETEFGVEEYATLVVKSDIGAKIESISRSKQMSSPAAKADISQSVEDVENDIKAMETKHIAEMQRRSGKMNEIINKMIEAVSKEEQARKDCEDKKKARNAPSANDPEQEFSVKAYLMQEDIMEYRRSAVETMKKIYRAKQGVIDLRQKLDDIKKAPRSLNQATPEDNVVSNGGDGNAASPSSDQIFCNKMNGINNLLKSAHYSESSLGEGMKCLKDALASIFAMAQWALGAGKEDATMKFIEYRIEYLGKLEDMITAKAEKEAKKAFYGLNNKNDPNKQLECVIQVLENFNIMMEMDSPADAYDNKLEDGRVALEIAFDILKSKKQNDDDESKKLDGIIDDLFKKLNPFYSGHESTTKLLQEFKILFLQNVSSSKVGIQAAMAERIADAVQIFSYECLIGSARSFMELPINMETKLKSFIERVKTAMGEIRILKNEYEKIFVELNNSTAEALTPQMQNTGEYAEIMRVKAAKINKMKELIEEMKEQNNKINKVLDEIIKILEKEEQVTANNDESTKIEDAVSSFWMYLLQKRIMEYQLYVTSITERLYQIKQNIAYLEKKLDGIE